MDANVTKSSDNLRKFNAKRWGATILSQAPTLTNVHHLAAGSTGSPIMRHATQSRISPKTICGALLCALVISASFTGGTAQLEDQAQRSLLQTRRAPAPAPSGVARTACSLPNGQTVYALKGSSEQSLFAYVSTSYSYTTVVSTAVSYFSYGYFGGYYWWGRKMLQAQAAPAPAPTGPLFAYPACCPSRLTLSGDTVTSLVGDKSLNALFYAINPQATPRDAPDSPLSPGQNVTIPCSRIISLGIPA